MPGIQDVFTINIFNENYVRSFFDVATFPELLVVAENSAWEVFQAKKNLKVEWENAPESSFTMTGFGGKKSFKVTVPELLESTAYHPEKWPITSKIPEI